jgi:sporulation protein YlmC with PRC-barrel domain
MKNNIAKTSKMTVGALTSIALVSAGSLFAGDYKDKDKHHGSMSDRHQSEAETAMLARSIEGMNINLEKGKEVGVIDDFVFSTDTGKIEGISIGTGFWGLGGSDHYVGFEELAMYDIGDQNLTTDLRMSELEDYSRLDEDELQTSTDKKNDIRSGELLAMELIGHEVEGADGASHGEVHDWIVDLQTGAVPYVVVSQLEPFGGMSPQGYNYYAVSTDLIEGVRDGELILSASSDDFASAEHIDEDTALSEADEGSVRSFRYDGSMAQASR